MTGLLVPRNDDSRVIVGQLLTFDANAGKWSLSGKPLPHDWRLLVIGTTAAAQQWHGGKTIDTVWADEGRDLHEICEEGNAAIPQSEWELSQDGKAKPPWSVSCIVYLVDPQTAKKFTIAAATVGERIATEILSDQIAAMRKLRGSDVLPEIVLGVDTFPTRFGGRKPRPDFDVKVWRSLGKETTQLALPAVSEPTSGELFDDSIPF
jgi:hypothetical protein